MSRSSRRASNGFPLLTFMSRVLVLPFQSFFFDSVLANTSSRSVTWTSSLPPPMPPEATGLAVNATASPI
ncbi:hypothetical protein F2Q69_00029967 [Brassica cretica]|uniref:Secreted protein n=1 Tax=Brassica cretica TaxID=69181 RepID=A0A8S9SAG3_BRACR|nr:hypothetical protein F2Q69_00029967 [Brassica cretica]